MGGITIRVFTQHKYLCGNFSRVSKSMNTMHSSTHYSHYVAIQRVSLCTHVCMTPSTALLLEGTCNLTELVLINCRIGENGACQLARAIRANSALKKLYLRHNPLGEGGAQALVESLAHNSNIKLALSNKYKYTIREYGTVSKQIVWHSY